MSKRKIRFVNSSKKYVFQKRKKSLRNRPPCSVDSPSLQIHFSIWHHCSTAINLKKLQKLLRHQNKFTDFRNFDDEHPKKINTMLTTNCANHPGGGITLRLTPHTTAASLTSAGGMHRWESFPSRPSTLINLNLKFPPRAPLHA